MAETGLRMCVAEEIDDRTRMGRGLSQIGENGSRWRSARDCSSLNENVLRSAALSCLIDRTQLEPPRMNATRLKLAALLTGLVLVASPGQRNGVAADGQLDKYGGWTGIQGKKTGFFHVEEIEGRNWFITPDGNAFFAISLSHMLSGESNIACDNVYGGDRDAWLKGSFEHARKMGFN